jgi:hypothetical protein
MMQFKRTLVAAIAALALSASAGLAATVTLVNNGDSTVATGVSTSLAGFTTVSSSGFTTELNSVGGVTRSPFENTAADGVQSYFNIAKDGWLDLTLDIAGSSLSFLWGSPDSYNFVKVFFDDSTFKIFSLGDIPAPPVVTPQRNANFVTISASDALITGIRFSTTGTAFELSNISSVPQVPLPAGGILLLSALGGIGALRRFRKSA